MTQPVPDQRPGADIPRAYNPTDVEPRIYQLWEEGGYFTPKIEPGKDPFVVIMPPPNVTGELHLGHALTAATEDVLIRWHRMMGDPALWLPGKDHAGIATQWVVERQLAQEGTSRTELGRDAFLERVWQWVERYGNTIDEQHKRLGASCDWSRLRFTLDPGPALAVRTTFVNLYNKGLIYRGERIINWCPRCSTALSDLEVDHEEHEGALYHIRYPLAPKDGEADGHVTVATTRPETMLGDTGVAVHPDDQRYSHLVGRNVTLPIIGRAMPIVGDEAIQPEFGTGCLKVTPGHDPVDFEIGQRHNLATVTVIGPDGHITAEGGPYEGRERFEARREIVAQLEREGLLEKVEPYNHSVGQCQRCSSVLEPLISVQWFLAVGQHDDPSSIAGRAYAAVAEGRIRIVPERFNRVYLNWLENIRDWCISRQLWWGHRIPVWYCRACGGETASVDDIALCGKCGSPNVEQDNDVLDTWFSSGLWTHSTLGWPEATDDLDYFYPTAVMETGYDILFFWVARMIMLGLENTGREPFHTIYLHGLIRDANGAKMSKSRGNAMDPLLLVDQYGTDALRFALTTGTSPGNDLRLTDGKLEASRNFANKLWNASRFVLVSLEGADASNNHISPLTPTHREDRWIISRLNQVADAVNSYLQHFELGEAQRELYDFIWHEFCDWYIELAKLRLRNTDGESPLPVLAHVLEQTLRLLHPFMPFITEEIWQRLKPHVPNSASLPDSIMVSDYPKPDPAAIDAAVDAELNLVQDIITQVRNYRAEEKIPAGQQIEATVALGPVTSSATVQVRTPTHRPVRASKTFGPVTASVEVHKQEPTLDGPSEQVQTAAVASFHEAISSEASAIKSLARLSDLTVVQPGGATPSTDPRVKQVDADGIQWHLYLPTPSVTVTNRTKLEKELSDLLKQIDRLAGQLGNEEFRSKAPAEVRQRMENQQQAHLTRKEQLEDQLAQMG